MSIYQTQQEDFWAGGFGDQYSTRNSDAQLVSANLEFFKRALRQIQPPRSCLEFGANIGQNLKALRELYPECRLQAIEINQIAAASLANWLGEENVFHVPISQFDSQVRCELVVSKGLLIHIAPEQLPLVYERLYRATERYVLIAEYYNPTPVSQRYRGHEERLFKRDFAGELLDLFPDLRLRDYGFSYHRDPIAPQDDLTWFLLER